MSEQTVKKLKEEIRDLKKSLDAENYFRDYETSYHQMLVAHLYVEKMMTYQQLNERHYLEDSAFSDWFQDAINTYYYADPVKLHPPVIKTEESAKDMFARLKKQTNNE